MFTTKGLNCAACAKGVTNMLGFRADHVSWQNFPFKEPGQRMNKLGQGFSKQYNQSQYDASYYNGGGRGTTVDDMHGSVSHKNLMGNPMAEGMMGGQKAGGKRARPMTAKINNKRGQF